MEFKVTAKVYMIKCELYLVHTYSYFVIVEFVVNKTWRKLNTCYDTMVVEEKSNESLKENQINDDAIQTGQKMFSLKSILLKERFVQESSSVNAICYFLTFV